MKKKFESDRTCWFSDAVCPMCGCMMATNNRASWCVSINCGFVEDEQSKALGGKSREEQIKNKKRKA